MSAPSSDPHRFAREPESPIPSLALDLFRISSRLSLLSEEELKQHIVDKRDEVFPVAPYPCLGSFRFLMPAIHTCGPTGTYQALLEHLKSSAVDAAVPRKHLDLGCAMGQDTRKLIFDGVPADRLVAADLCKELIEAGHAMYDDEGANGRLAGIKWLVCDVFDAEHVERVRAEVGQEGYGSIYVGSFLHLFDLGEEKGTGAPLRKQKRLMCICSRVSPTSLHMIYPQRNRKESSTPWMRYSPNVQARKSWADKLVCRAAVRPKRSRASGEVISRRTEPTDTMWIRSSNCGARSGMCRWRRRSLGIDTGTEIRHPSRIRAIASPSDCCSGSCANDEERSGSSGPRCRLVCMSSSYNKDPQSLVQRSTIARAQTVPAISWQQ